MKIKEIFENYINSAEFKALSKRTTKNYFIFINKLSPLIGEHDVENPCEYAAKNGYVFGEKNDYKVWLSNKISESLNGWVTKNSAKYARTVLMIVFRFALKKGMISWQIWEYIPEIKVELPDTVAMNKEEADKIKGLSVEPWQTPYKQMLLFCFYSGLRPNEAESLVWADVEEHIINVRFAKGRQQGKVSRICKITDEIRSVLPERKESSWPVFSSLRGKKLNKDQRSQSTRLIMKAIGSNKPFYSSRRGTATEMHKSGKYDVLQISNQLGHKHIEMTSRYIRPTMIEKAMGFGGF